MDATKLLLRTQTSSSKQTNEDWAQGGKETYKVYKYVEKISVFCDTSAPVIILTEMKN